MLALPDLTHVYLCHDYPHVDRSDFAWSTTHAEQRRGNVHVADAIGEDDFVRMREARDAILQMPVLILPEV